MKEKGIMIKDFRAFIFVPLVVLIFGCGESPENLPGVGSLRSLASHSPGDLDPTFGTGGKVVADLGSYEQVYRTALQSDGRIIVLGGGVLARYHPDGTLDSTFGISGLASVTAGKALAVQADDKILVGGVVFEGDIGTCTGCNGDFLLERYDPDGSLDTGFGVGGRVTTEVGAILSGGSTLSDSDSIEDLAVQTDGKIVAVGTSYRSDFEDYVIEAAIARYLPSGALDTSFGPGGVILPGTGGFKHVTIQGDGKILATGSHLTFINCRRIGNNYPGCGFPVVYFFLYDVAMARFTSDGNLDPGFNDSGWLILDFGSDTEGGLAAEIQPGGRIIVLAYGPFQLLGITQGGLLDSGFGSGGLVPVDMGRALTLQPDGKILIAGGYQSDFGLLRYDSDGILDSGFGVNGRVTTDFLGGNDFANAVLVLPDGGILTGGSVFNGMDTDMGLARYLGGEGLITTTSTTSTTSTSTTTLPSAYKLTTFTNYLFADPPPGEIIGAGTPAPIACPPGYKCYLVSPGVTLTLTAVSFSGYEFSEWGNDCAGQGNPCVFIMDYNKVVSANFAPVSTTSTTSTTSTSTSTSSTTTSTTTSTLPQVTEADLALSMAESADPIFLGETVIYTAAVMNNGPDPATGVVLQVTPPNSFQVLTTPSQGACNFGANPWTPFSCDLGTIANEAGATVTFTVEATFEQSLFISASVSSAATDPDLSNNNATEETTVTGGGGVTRPTIVRPPRPPRPTVVRPTRPTVR